MSEIHCFKVSVTRALAGQSCSIAFWSKDKNIELKLNDMTKSKTILIDVDEIPKLRYEFRVELTLYSSKSDITINSNTEIYINSDTFKQCCTVVRNQDVFPNLKMERIISKSKDKKFETIIEKKKKRSDSEVFVGDDLFGILRENSFNVILTYDQPNYINFRFKFKPQFVRIGQKILIHTPKIKAVGVVTKVYD